LQGKAARVPQAAGARGLRELSSHWGCCEEKASSVCGGAGLIQKQLKARLASQVTPAVQCTKQQPGF